MKEFLKLLVFDCDGVLFDSKQANTEFYNYILKKIGRAPMTEKEIEFIHMHSVTECIEFLLRSQPEKLDLAKKIQKETPFNLFFKYMILEKGVKEFLEWAKKFFYIALCTNRTTSTKPLLEHFKLINYFDFIMCAEKVPKSDPSALLNILKHFRLKPNEAIYIGDSKVDEVLCKSCNVKFIAFKNPKLDADFYVNSYDELKTLIERSFSFVKKG